MKAKSSQRMMVPIKMTVDLNSQQKFQIRDQTQGKSAYLSGVLFVMISVTVAHGIHGSKSGLCSDCHV